MGREAEVRQFIVYTLLGSLVYMTICGLGWSWILGLEFAWWKLPILGAANATLNIVANALIPKKTPPAAGKE